MQSTTIVEFLQYYCYVNEKSSTTTRFESRLNLVWNLVDYLSSTATVATFIKEILELK